MPPCARKPLDLTATSTMLVLCLCWGFQQVAIKMVADDISATLQIGLRSVFAALVLGLVLLRAEGRRVLGDGTLPAGLLVGTLFALEFLLLGLALRYTTASHAAVFLYTAPIFTALGLHLRHPDERMRPLQWLGIAIAFAGIAAAFLGKRETAIASAPDMLLGDLLALLAGAGWGATTVAIRCSALADARPAKTLFYQMAMAALLLCAWHAVSGDPAPVFSAPAIASMAFQCVVVALSSYLAWFWLLRRYLATRLSVLSFVTPLFGVIFGVLILDEPIEPSFAVGALLVLAGIVLVSGAELLSEKLRLRGR
ncbi:DMT family transporter [Bordetella genomosp. 13]|uniref:EamA family transporter n=1 Tax=Bordetella genomosp. 13 TaxID=463040 RepID=A0A1W6ZAT3_9BORD|nr:DMT family transporter [Bordetella genomosp. 13]ARP94429.1 EamA family transporter [Bordetella genomosp. 13]